MATPHKCPVCDGTGLVSRPPNIAGDVPSWTDSGSAPYSCRPCFGTGIIWDHASPPSGAPAPWPGVGWTVTDRLAQADTPRAPILITRFFDGSATLPEVQ